MVSEINIGQGDSDIFHNMVDVLGLPPAKKAVAECVILLYTVRRNV